MIVVTVFLKILNPMKLPWVQNKKKWTELHWVQNRKESRHHDHIPFTFDSEPNGIQFGSKSKLKPSPRLYCIEFERKCDECLWVQHEHSACNLFPWTFRNYAIPWALHHKWIQGNSLSGSYEKKDRSLDRLDHINKQSVWIHEKAARSLSRSIGLNTWWSQFTHVHHW